jgi:hypothetical protein
MLTLDDKVRLLRDLTQGADDVFAVHSETWRPVYTPLDDNFLRLHLQGAIEIGSYPLIPAGAHPRVYWVAADFDGKRPGSMWKTDVQRATRFLLDTGAAVFVNLSRSAIGAHVRVLFAEPVPAWVARRWMQAWLEEAGVAQDPDEWDKEVPPSFDRLIPPQDFLSGRLNDEGRRLPGNLIGSPLHGGRARANGGTLPLGPAKVAMGDFAPDGNHWDHVRRALDSRTWGENALYKAASETPGLSLDPPLARIALPVVRNQNADGLHFMMTHCEFLRYLKAPGNFTYPLWLALATQLQPYGEPGLEAFHALSALDSRYDTTNTNRKWQQTAMMSPIRCDTLVEMGYRCPHLYAERCNGTNAPSFLFQWSNSEWL